VHLLQVEANVVQGCLSAGQSMAEFIKNESTDIKAATRALQKFEGNWQIPSTTT
jgi:hypothetical protein